MKKEVIKKVLPTIYLLFLIVIIYFFIFYKLNNNNIFDKNKLIGHATYGINNIYYTNSYEALELAYNNKIKLIEIDFLLTTDKKLVLNHYWENNKIDNYNTFMNKKIKNKYTPMDIDMLLEYMQKHKDLYIIIDTKEDEYSNQKLDIYKIIIDKCQKKDKELLNRFIPQIYNHKDYKDIKKIYNFKEYIYTIYKLKKISMVNITYYCLYNNIQVIALPKETLDSKAINSKVLAFIKRKNIKIYTYTINDINEYKIANKLNIDGIYTDTLNYDLIKGANNE